MSQRSCKHGWGFTKVLGKCLGCQALNKCCFVRVGLLVLLASALWPVLSVLPFRCLLGDHVRSSEPGPPCRYAGSGLCRGGHTIVFTLLARWLIACSSFSLLICPIVHLSQSMPGFFLSGKFHIALEHMSHAHVQFTSHPLNLAEVWLACVLAPTCLLGTGACSLRGCPRAQDITLPTSPRQISKQLPSGHHLQRLQVETFTDSGGKHSGCESKLNHPGTAGFSLLFNIPGFHFGYLFLTHSHSMLFEDESKCPPEFVEAFNDFGSWCLG